MRINYGHSVSDVTRVLQSAGRLKRLVLPALTATLLATSLADNSAAWQQRPATPPPCAADCACRPQGPWGYTGTKWRPWPGDVIGQAAPSAAEAEAQEQLRLDPFELPPPEKENQRGPNTTKRPKASEAAEAAPGLEQPGVDKNDAPEPDVPLPDDVGPLEGAPAEEPPVEAAEPAGAQPEGGLGLPDGFELDSPAENAPAEQPPAEIRQPENLEQPPAPTEQPEQPAEDFDPFSQLDEPRSTPARVGRRAATTVRDADDAPPALPASLRKLGRSGPPAPRTSARTVRYERSAPMVQ